MTKKQTAQKRRDDWRAAVAEGRVVKFDDLTMRSYHSREAAELAAATAREDGIDTAHVVNVEGSK